MKNLLLLFPVLLMLTTPSDKAIKKHIKENLHTIKSIDPQDTGFDDLAAIGAAIGNAKVVMLGEQCHGDGATFAAKSRLIKYLHEVKGFHVLAFEADFFTLNNYGSANLMNNVATYKRIAQGINNIWSQTEECNYLFNDYIPSTYATRSALWITGFDNQFYGLYGSNKLTNLLKTSLKPGLFDKDITYLLNAEFFNSLDTLMSSLYKSKQQLLNPSVQYTSMINNLRDKIDTLLAHSKPDSSNFDLQILKNIRATHKQISNLNKSEFNSLRDSIMSENVLWLLEHKFRNEKMIIWAANSHICKQTYAISNGPFYPMGSLVNRNLKNGDSYILGFTSKEGEHGTFTTKKISKPLSAAFESWVPGELEYAFLDLKSRPDLASESFYMRALGHGNLKMNWQSKFDGIFYIRDMYPSHKLKK